MVESEQAVVLATSYTAMFRIARAPGQANRRKRWLGALGFVGVCLAVPQTAVAMSARFVPFAPGVWYGDLSCTSRNACTAVGDNGMGATIGRWNGSSWRSQPNPASTNGGYLDSVSCATSRLCTAVGGGGGSDGPLIERWQDSRWSLQRSPAAFPPADQEAWVLTSVSCPTQTMCAAIGGSNDYGALIEMWNGKRWRITNRLGQYSILNGVSCSSATSCFAVGGCDALGVCAGNPAIGPGPSGEVRWNGRKWTALAAPKYSNLVTASRGSPGLPAVRGERSLWRRRDGAWCCTRATAATHVRRRVRRRLTTDAEARCAGLWRKRVYRRPATRAWLYSRLTPRESVWPIGA